MSQLDVAIIGAGIAGLTASILLRQADLRVICVDAQAHPHAKVGESLDWSSPGLLRRLGIDAQSLLDGAVATYKKHITVYELDGRLWTATPPPIIRRSPLRFETVTLHVDRRGLDGRLFDRATSLGTVFLWDRVTRVATSGDRVIGCDTATGQHIEARWYIDASGTSRVLSRAMDIRTVVYGRPKVCLWTYFDTPPLHDGTAFFVDNSDDYLSWVWDIPISPTQTSVGFVLPADTVRDRRRGGVPVATILRDELTRHARFRGLLDTQPETAVETTSFQPYVTARVAGANWLMIGEAAAMPDPLTGNGVTSGLRHAAHAAEALLATGEGPSISGRQALTYTRHVHRLGHAFNAHIENAVYRPPLRHGLGLKTATYVYTFFAFFMNALHARFEPRGPAGMAVFKLLFAGASAWIAGWTLLARGLLWSGAVGPTGSPGKR